MHTRLMDEYLLAGRLPARRGGDAGAAVGPHPQGHWRQPRLRPAARPALAREALASGSRRRRRQLRACVRGAASGVRTRLPPAHSPPQHPFLHRSLRRRRACGEARAAAPPRRGAPACRPRRLRTNGSPDSSRAEGSRAERRERRPAWRLRPRGGGTAGRCRETARGPQPLQPTDELMVNSSLIGVERPRGRPRPRRHRRPLPLLRRHRQPCASAQAQQQGRGGAGVGAAAADGGGASARRCRPQEQPGRVDRGAGGAGGRQRRLRLHDRRRRPRHLQPAQSRGLAAQPDGASLAGGRQQRR